MNQVRDAKNWDGSRPWQEVRSFNRGEPGQIWGVLCMTCCFVVFNSWDIDVLFPCACGHVVKWELSRFGLCRQSQNKCCEERLIRRSALVLHPIDNAFAIRATRLVFCKEEVRKGQVHGGRERQLDICLCFFNKLFLLITVRLYEGIFQALLRSQLPFQAVCLLLHWCCSPVLQALTRPGL